MGVTYAAIDRFLLTGEGEEADLAIIDRFHQDARSISAPAQPPVRDKIDQPNTAREGGVFLRSIPIPMCFAGATIGRPCFCAPILFVLSFREREKELPRPVKKRKETKPENLSDGSLDSPSTRALLWTCGEMEVFAFAVFAGREMSAIGKIACGTGSASGFCVARFLFFLKEKEKDGFKNVSLSAMVGKMRIASGGIS